MVILRARFAFASTHENSFCLPKGGYATWVRGRVVLRTLIFWLFRRPDAQHCCRKDDARRDGHTDWHGIPSSSATVACDGSVSHSLLFSTAPAATLAAALPAATGQPPALPPSPPPPSLAATTQITMLTRRRRHRRRHRCRHTLPDHALVPPPQWPLAA